MINIKKRQMVVLATGAIFGGFGFSIYNILFAGVGVGLVLSTIAYNDYKVKVIGN